MPWSEVVGPIGLCVIIAGGAACGRTSPAPAAQSTPPSESPSVQPQPDANPPATPRSTPPGGISPGGLVPGSQPGSAPSPEPVLTPLAKESIALARSADPAETARLIGRLQDPQWLDTLDPPAQAVSVDPRFLQLVPVLRALGAASSSSLEPLAASPEYTKVDYRLAALIIASGAAKKPGDALVALWKSQLEPEADELESTVAALVASESERSLAILNEVLGSGEFDDEVVVMWMRSHILRNRQSEPLLASLESLIRSEALSPARSAALVESLFSYKPDEWHVPTAEPPVPPSRASLTPGAKRRLLMIADLALKQGTIDAARREAIERELSTPPG